MARADYRIQDTGGLSATPSRRFISEDRTTSTMTRVTYSGEPIKTKSTASPYVIPLATGDPELGTDQFIGVAASDSNETSAAVGDIEVYCVIPMVTVMAAKATTAANVDTQSEIDALLNQAVCGDVSSLVYTIDEDEGEDDNVHGFLIVGGNPDTKELYFTVKPLCSLFGSSL